MDYSKIAPNLYLGGKPETFEDYEFLSTFDVVYEFNKSEDFSKKHLNHILGSPLKIGDLVDKIKKIAWYQTPLNDEIPTGAIKNYNKVLLQYVMDNYQRKKIYVHCKNGLHRSAHFLIFVAMQGGQTYDEAFHSLRMKRKIEVKPLLKKQLVEWYDDLRPIS